jgi:uncharacterized protein YxeA
MNRRLQSILTKILIIIASLFIIPEIGSSQDRGAKSVKSDKGSKKGKRVRNSYNGRKRTGKKQWKNQDKSTRKRMKRAAKNAKRRQKGKPMKNNRLV